jgi:hypothetical protein
MAAEPKPETAAGYRREETEQVEAACLTIATTLGDLMDEVCIVGGLVPSMLIDRGLEASDDPDVGHCGTNDLDVALSVVLMDGERYAEISQRLREAGFRPDETDEGQQTRQRWRLGDLKVTVDFLIAPLSDEKEGGDLQDLEADFAAIVAPGAQLAFDEQITIRLEGRDLNGDLANREIRVCGPGAFTVLKAHAFRRRGLGKDAYDLVYVLRLWPQGVDDVADRLAAHAKSEPDTVREALAILAEDFETIDHLGPRRASRFETGENDDARAADSQGVVDDLLRAYQRLGITNSSP